MMSFEEEFPSLTNVVGRVYPYIDEDTKKLLVDKCLDKKRVKRIINKFEQFHFEKESDHPSMKIHYSDFKILKKELGF